MAHPYQLHREHTKERERVSRLYGEHEGHRDYEQVYHRARGGKVEHHDEAEDKAVVRSMVKGAALKSGGNKSHHRADKRARGGKVKKRADGGSLAEKAAKVNLREKMGGEPAFFGPLNRKLYGVPLKGKSQDQVNATMRGQMKEAEDISDAVPRARGGKVKHKGKTVVNVNVAPQQSAPHPMPVPMPPPGANAAPVPQPRPPLPAPGGAPGVPPGMPPRARGGRIAGFATGGPVEPHFKAGVGMGPSGHGAAKGKKVSLPKNAIYAPAKGDMAPTSGTGTGGGVARMELAHRARKVYAKTPPAIHTPGMRND